MSQSVIGALRVTLGLDSAQFDRGTRRAGDSLKSMRQQFTVVAGAAAAFGAAIAAAARHGAQQIDDAAKAARRIDGTVAGYRALEMAADDAGVSLSSLASDVQTMNRELARAEIGQGRAGDALERLGMVAADFSGLDADERIALLADRVQDLGLNSGETTLLLRDLGVRNREMALLVMQGGEALRRARTDVEDFGLAISDVDASRIEAANDEISGLADISTYVSDQLALKFIPAMGNLAKAMTDSLREGGLLRQMLDGLVNNIQRLITYVGTAVAAFGIRYVAALVAARIATLNLAGALMFLRGALIRTGIGALVVGAGELIYQFSRLVEGAGGFGNAMGLLGDLGKAVFSEMQDAGGALMWFLDAAAWQIAKGFVDAFQWILEQWDGLINAMYTPFNALMEAVGSEHRLQSAVNSMLDGASAALANRAQESMGRARGIYEGMTLTRQAVDALRQALSGATDDIDTTEDAAQRLNDALEGIGDGSGGGSAGGAEKAVESATGAMQNMGDIGQQIASTLASSFTDMFMSALDGSKSLIDSIGDLLKSLGRLLLNQAFSMLFGGLFGGGGGGLFGGFRAEGGPVTAGRSYVVGERGPELFTPGSNGGITANHKLGERKPTQINLIVQANDMFEATVARIAGEGDVRVVKSIEKGLPGMMAEHQMRHG